MKKLLGIVVLGFLWCNISFAERVNRGWIGFHKCYDAKNHLVGDIWIDQDFKQMEWSDYAEDPYEQGKRRFALIKIDFKKYKFISEEIPLINTLAVPQSFEFSDEFLNHPLYSLWSHIFRGNIKTGELILVQKIARTKDENINKWLEDSFEMKTPIVLRDVLKCKLKISNSTKTKFENKFIK